MTIPNDMTSIKSGVFGAFSGLTSIIIPKRVVNIGSKAFERCIRLTIYAEAANKPDGWAADWNVSNRPVVWGCMLSEDKKYVVSFTKTANNIENYDALSAPYREGYDLEGWFSLENEQMYSTANIHTVQNGVKLFAIWKKVNSEKTDTIKENDSLGLDYKFDKLILEELKLQMKKIIED